MITPKVTALLTEIIQRDHLHLRWLNTLSLLEYSGARKIFTSQGLGVELDVVQHAAEEARHAYFFKLLMKKITEKPLSDYRDEHLLAAKSSRRYLSILDIKISRYLKATGLSVGPRLRQMAYILTTLSIEKRAQVLYPAYENLLLDFRPELSLISIIKEEDRHLEEMNSQLRQLFPHTLVPSLLEQLDAWEKEFFQQWIEEIAQEVYLFKSKKLA